MTDADWQKALDSTYPPERITRLAYADWLQEQGREDEAYLQRWLGKGGRGFISGHSRISCSELTGFWYWSNLPDSVWRQVDGIGNFYHELCDLRQYHPARAAGPQVSRVSLESRG